MHEDSEQVERGTAPKPQVSRRRFLQQAGAIGLAGVAGPIVGGQIAGAAPAFHRRRAGDATSPIKHIIIACQENHTFDNYLGSYAGLPQGWGIPPGYTQPDGNGGTVAAYHFDNLTSNGDDPDHSWDAIHGEWDNGKMDGFYTTNGIDALGYYDETDIPFYYSLLPHFTVCANYFCGVLAETFPNRLVLVSGTSGGNTSNSIQFGSLTYPCILDLLQTYGVTFGHYRFHYPIDFSMFGMFKNWLTGGPNGELNLTHSQFFEDLKNGTLPQVSWISTLTPYDEHPPSDIQLGEQILHGIVGALRKSPLWESTALFITYDEGGGFFDHVAPPQLDAYGPGLRVPMTVVSPHARRNHVDTTFSDHTSVLKFIERSFGLPTLASINHEFDTSTPTTNNQANGAPFPPRDGYSETSDMTQCFWFG